MKPKVDVSLIAREIEDALSTSGFDVEVDLYNLNTNNPIAIISINHPSTYTVYTCSLAKVQEPKTQELIKH